MNLFFFDIISIDKKISGSVHLNDKYSFICMVEKARICTSVQECDATEV